MGVRQFFKACCIFRLTLFLFRGIFLAVIARGRKATNVPRKVTNGDELSVF